jgi:ABC-type Na+ efflux pump permease subunit
MQRSQVELVCAVVVTGLCIAGFYEATQYPGASGLLPKAALALGILLSVIWIVQCLMAIKKGNGQEEAEKNQPKDTPLDEEPLEEDEPLNWKKLAFFVPAMLIYAIAIPMIGYFTSTLLFVPLVSFGLGYRNKKTLVVAPVLFVAVLHLLFIQILQIPLPDELIFQLGSLN